jgi:Ca2+-binding EF-hand superfamily protein
MAKPPMMNGGPLQHYQNGSLNTDDVASALGTGSKQLRHTDQWKIVFDLYAVDGKLDLENFQNVCKGVCSRYLEGELEEMEQIMGEVAEKNTDGKLQFHDLRMVMCYHGLLERQWMQRAKMGKATEGIGFDVFEQLLRAQRFFIDSYPDPNGLDQTNLSYVLSAVGEEMDLEDFEEFCKVIGHPSKGPFKTSLFMEQYMKVAKQVGIFSAEDEEKARHWIEQSKNLEKSKSSKKPAEPESAAPSPTRA